MRAQTFVLRKPWYPSATTGGQSRVKMT